MTYNEAKRGEDMTNYMKDTGMVERKLIDSSCDGDTIKRFMELAKAGDYIYEMSGQMKTLLDPTNPLFPGNTHSVTSICWRPRLTGKKHLWMEQ